MDARKLLGVAYPIIQAPMAGVQGSELAIAVSNAGGLGSLPGAMLDPTQLRAELTAIAAATSRPFNVNFFTHREPALDEPREVRWRERLAPYFRELGIDVDSSTIAKAPVRGAFDERALEVLEELRPKVVSFHFGLPSATMLERVHAFGAVVLSSATTIDEARWLEANGADAVIAQGLEAGGHRGMFLDDDLATQVGTMTLVRQIVSAVRIPVFAAGGIVDAEGVRAALALGASGVQVGTAYMLCPEARTSQLHRRALTSDAARKTAITNVFTGRPARSIVNRIVRELGPIHPDAPAFPRAAGPLAPLRAKAESLGVSEWSPLWAGQNAPLCRPMPAAELTRMLAEAWS